METVVDSLVDRLSSVFVEISVHGGLSTRSTLKEQWRLQARQVLTIDHVADMPSGSRRVEASIDESGFRRLAVFGLDDHAVADISGHLAQWILSSWADKMAIGRRSRR